jgi:hypothetical protein
MRKPKVAQSLATIILLMGMARATAAFSPVGNQRPIWPGKPATISYAINANFGVLAHFW